MEQFLMAVAEGLRTVGFDAEVRYSDTLSVCGMQYHCYQGRGGYVFIAGTRLYRSGRRGPYSATEGVGAVLSALANDLKAKERVQCYKDRCDNLRTAFPNAAKHGSSYRKLSEHVTVEADDEKGYKLVVRTDDLPFLRVMADMMQEMTEEKR